MRQPKLIDVEPDRTNTRKFKIDQFKEYNRIWTHFAKHMSRDEEPWTAFLVPDRIPMDEGAVFEWVAERVEELDETGLMANGTTERLAIRNLCEQNKIPCDL